MLASGLGLWVRVLGVWVRVRGWGRGGGELRANGGIGVQIGQPVRERGDVHLEREQVLRVVRVRARELGSGLGL